MRSCLFTLPVRGSEGLYMVNGPPSFTESTAFQRYCCAKDVIFYKVKAGSSTEKCMNISEFFSYCQ